MKRQLLVLAFVSLSYLIICAHAATSYNVGAFGEVTNTVQLYQGDSISGTLDISGGYGTFVIQDPDKTPVYTSGMTNMNGGTITFSYTAEKSGSYSIIYWNMAFQSVQVTLDYSVKSSGIGFIGFIQGNWLPILVLFGFVLVPFLMWRLKAKKQGNVGYPPPSGMPPTSEIKCGSCGTLNSLDAMYCKKCGNRLR